MTQVTVYQAEVGLPSGIGPMAADECQIDPVAFAAFVNALLAWHGRTRHAGTATLAEGFVATVPVLAEIANIEVSRQSAQRAESHYLGTASDPHAKEWAAVLQQKSRELTCPSTTPELQGKVRPAMKASSHRGSRSPRRSPSIRGEGPHPRPDAVLNRETPPAAARDSPRPEGAGRSRWRRVRRPPGRAAPRASGPAPRTAVRCS
ncbi:DUF6086 family protein [Streptomyces sp. NPDC091287]|uniref:DUF6086 family protein n=1 Tax=Streptomyces sp. NPDC091287 TaxID=3365988 RepID=UPI003808199A